MVKSQKFYFLRLSDGKHVSPVVAIFWEKFTPVFKAGAVLQVNGVRILFVIDLCTFVYFLIHFIIFFGVEFLSKSPDIYLKSLLLLLMCV